MARRPVAGGRIDGELTVWPTVFEPAGLSVSIVTVWMRPVWLEMTSVIGPAPTRAGEICTRRGWIAPVSVTGVGGRLTFLRGPPEPHAATPAVPARASAAARSRRRTLGPEASARGAACAPVDPGVAGPCKAGC